MLEIWFSCLSVLQTKSINLPVGDDIFGKERDGNMTDQGPRILSHQVGQGPCKSVRDAVEDQPTNLSTLSETVDPELQ